MLTEADKQTIREALEHMQEHLETVTPEWERHYRREEFAAIRSALAAVERLDEGGWEPVEDGEYDMGNDTILYVFGNTDPDVCTHVEYDEIEIMLDLGMTICRRA